MSWYNMNNYLSNDTKLRLQIKDLVLQFMQSRSECSAYSEGMKQAEIFRECGLDWRTYENATGTNQQYWICRSIKRFRKRRICAKGSCLKKMEIEINIKTNSTVPYLCTYKEVF